MPQSQYNAVIKYAPNQGGTYHNITNISDFIAEMVRLYDAHTIFFYSLPDRRYCGFWRKRYTYKIHQNG